MGEKKQITKRNNTNTGFDFINLDYAFKSSV